jgi:hypothetical protein
MSARQQNGMSRLMLEMFQEAAFTDSTSRSQGQRADFQYLAERTKGVSSHLGRLIRARVSHHDNPQLVPPTGMAVGCEDTEDASGYRGGVIARWNDNADRLARRGEPRRLVVRAGMSVTGRRRLRYFFHCLRVAERE